MEIAISFTRVAAVITSFSFALILLWNLFSVKRNQHDLYVPESCDCRRHCEWQLAKMNETFNTLITVCEEKLQKLHGSDMNMAIIREQLHKEILELFWYEFQTFQRLHNSKTEHVPQFCSEYCSTADLAKHKDECKRNTTKLFNSNQQLVQRQRWLRFQLKLRLRPPKAQIETAKIFSSTDLWAVTVPITFVITIIILIRVNKDRFATLETEKARIETEVHVLRERNTTLADEAQTLTANLEAQQQHAEEFVSDKERLCEELEARNTILSVQHEALLERNGMLEYWNDALYTETAEQQFEIDSMRRKLNRSVQNAHKFWERKLLNERKARQEYEEELESSISSQKRNGRKREWKLITEYQKRMTEQENERTHMKESCGKQLQKRDKRLKELDVYIRELEREGTTMIKELEKLKMKCDVEKEGKQSALDQVSSLEREVTALKAQTARLEEGLQTKTKSYRSSRPLGFLRPSQTSISKEIVDSRLDDMRRQFETRLETQLADIQSKFESQRTRDSEELHRVRTEREELRDELELARRDNIQLQGRLARQKPSQPLHRQRSKRSSRTKVRAHSAKVKLQREISLSRDSDFRTQPEPTYISGRYGNTEYRLSDYSVWQ